MSLTFSWVDLWMKYKLPLSCTCSYSCMPGNVVSFLSDNADCITGSVGGVTGVMGVAGLDCGGYIDTTVYIYIDT